MENTAGTDIEMIIDSPLVVSIPQKKGKSTHHLRTPPKKQKRTTPIDFIPTNGNTGRKTSQIWDHFAKFIAKGGKRRAKCNYCVKHFTAETKTNGTSVLWSHLNDKCLKSPFRFVDRKQTTLKVVPIKVGRQENGTSSIEKVVYNMEDIKRAIAEFFIIDEQPFKVVEGEGFKKLMAKALPNFELPSQVIVARHCLKIYQEEKEKLKKLVKNQHICITSDTWTSLQNLTYMVVTAHWIDDEWNLQKKILNFFQTPDHKGETIAKVTLDNASANDAAIKHLKARIDDWKGVILRNEFLHVRCNVHILNIIVKEGLDEQIEPISRIRNAVKYVKSSASRFASFKSYIKKTKLDTHGLLSLDVETRWNSTYTMIETAVNFEKAFARIEDLILIDMAGRMKVKFDKYWEKIKKPENLTMLLFIAIVLDPRYKMRYVNFILSKTYGFLLGKLKADNVEGVLKRLYNHYNYSSTETFTNNIGGDTNMMGEVDDILHSQWEKHLEDEENIAKKSELDQYLMDNISNYFKNGKG
ncbi:zinc finger BED domain-containing protein RICESLEEPER 1-like [Solanum tuberosum]|uniref:zinc finger BED domain-containing protein RICESLEEPER 1-like n=1 Tax=Solanum tuberosum TaxID=4113 RepID=UPI00073A1939|nr:PREDICTED: zinc finger BED domain-containing protein RICESLEEPER 1-like [Solanum tuberosum]